MRFPETWRLPRWTSLPLTIAGVIFAHAWIPWFLSRFAARQGWLGGTPGLWNLLGLLFVAAGAVILTWALSLHFNAAPQGWRLEATPSYLLTSGPYAYSRNPLFVAEGVVWIGWTVFYGSLSVLATLVGISILAVSWFVPFEERKLEARFGDTYCEYKRRVPRWSGRPRM